LKSQQEELKPQFDLTYANRALVLFAVLAAFVLYVEFMLLPSLPAIAKDYSVNSAQASLILALYTVLGTAVNPLVGKLGDLFGKKKVLMFVLVIYSVMVTITSFATNFEILLASRAFQGIGLGIFPLAFSLAREQFPKEMIPRAQGLISAMFGAGTAAGLSGGAFVANSYGWQMNYHIATVFIVVLTVLVFFQVRESPFKNPTARLDYVGAGLLGAALAAIVFGLSAGSSLGWTSVPVLGLNLCGLLLLVPLVLFERKVKEPVLNLKLLGIRNVLISNGAALAYTLSMYAAFQAIIYQLELPTPVGPGFDILEAGLYVLPIAITLLVVAYFSGILISRLGVKLFLLLGGVIGAIGCYLASTSSMAIQSIEFLCFGAVGLGMLMVATQNLLVLTVKNQDMGLATSMSTVFKNIGSSLGAPISGSLISTYTAIYFGGGGPPMNLPTHMAFQYCYYAAMIGFIAAFALSLFALEVIGKKSR